MAFFSGCASPRGAYHTVEGGQTIFSISRIYGVDAAYLARINGVEDPSRLRAGQRLFIPDAKQVRPVPASSSVRPSPQKAEKKISARATSAKPQSEAPGAVKGAANPQVRNAERKGSSLQGHFVWPVRGKIVRQYGRQGNQACQGVEIAAPPGTPVLSAAAGRVTYSGKGIRGYGHLVILRHDGDFFTVYGFNQKSLVEPGAKVRQGQRIALSGVPPSGGPPRLHFEIRQGKSPLNPIFYLP